MKTLGIAVVGSCNLGQCKERGAINKIVSGKEGFGSWDGLWGTAK